ncbi:Copper chaperone CopZ [Kaistella daneshvariae]
MKTLLRSLLVFTLLISTFISAQTLTKSTFMVKGECGMCEERIETSAKKSGAKTAVWNAETQKLEVEFDPAKTSADLILKNIADVGHDNEKYRAPDTVYTNLPSCCHYERSADLISATTEISAPAPTQEYFVRGNCDMCKARIETAAKSAGATAANWSAETQKVSLEFDPAKTSAEAILKKIAEVGHDNEKFSATDTAYKKLPGCCLYDRDAEFGVQGEGVHSDAPKAKKDFSSFDDHFQKSIDEVRIVKTADATALSKKETGLTFNIGTKELLKAACCNLSESFETNATVDVSFSNAVTGTKQLKMLGLDQKYTSLTKELLPSVRGLAAPYGLNLIPGRWIGEFN